MRFFLFLGFTLSISLSCSSNKMKKAEDGSEYCDCEFLGYDNLHNHFFLENRDKPYTGICKSFYPSGKLKQERELKNGKNDGFFREYTENGKLTEEGSFKNNRHHGTFKYFDKNGNLIHEATFNEGVVVDEKSAQ